MQYMCVSIMLKIAPIPGKEDDEIIKYYICLSYRLIVVCKCIVTEVEDFEVGIIDIIFSIRVEVLKMRYL